MAGAFLRLHLSQFVLGDRQAGRQGRKGRNNTEQTGLLTMVCMSRQHAGIPTLILEDKFSSPSISKTGCGFLYYCSLGTSRHFGHGAFEPDLLSILNLLWNSSVVPKTFSSLHLPLDFEQILPCHNSQAEGTDSGQEQFMNFFGTPAAVNFSSGTA